MRFKTSGTFRHAVLAVQGVLAILCLTVLIGGISGGQALAAGEQRVAANLWDLLRGSQDNEEEKAEEKPEKKPEVRKDTKKDKQTETKSKPARKSKPTKSTKKKPANPNATRVAIVGDSLAQDLWFGMRRLFFRSKDVEVVRLTKSASGLVRDDSYDWNEKLEDFVNTENFQIAVVVFGGNDRQELRVGGKRLPRFSKRWEKEYSDRVDDVIRLLKRRADTVFWVSLPIARSERLTADYKKLNVIYKTRAEANGAEYVDIWTLFRDENGEYSSFGPDLKGVKRRLRMDDGLHFTAHGQGRFADEVLKIMRKKVKLSDAAVPVKIYAHRQDETPSLD